MRAAHDHRNALADKSRTQRTDEPGKCCGAGWLNGDSRVGAFIAVVLRG